MNYICGTTIKADSESHALDRLKLQEVNPAEIREVKCVIADPIPGNLVIALLFIVFVMGLIFPKV